MLCVNIQCIDSFLLTDQYLQKYIVRKNGKNIILKYLVQSKEWFPVSSYNILTSASEALL